MGKIIDMIGEKHNRLTVISRADNEGTRASWYCLCDCGNTTVVIGKKIRIDGNLFDIYQKEKTLKQENKPFRYRPIKFFNGHTECFSRPPELI